jgi:hypothetical protein
MNGAKTTDDKSGGRGEPRWARELVPRRLYKYMPYEGRSVQFVRALLRRRHLKFSTAPSFNDPFEARPHVRLPDGSTEDQRAMLRNIYEEMLAIAGGNFEPRPEISNFIESAELDAVRAKFEEVMRIVLGQRPVACLAGTRRSILMWSLYAGHHCGVCVYISPVGFSRWPPHGRSFMGTTIRP